MRAQHRGDILNNFRSSTSVFAVITGGGTSGHVIPALAIAELLVDHGYATKHLHFVGTLNGVETRLVPPAKIPMTLLDVHGFKRNFSPQAVRQNIKSVLSLRNAIMQAEILLQALQPKVVISVGGYGSVAATKAATNLDIPVVTVSYDRLPGLATKLQSRKAAATAVAYLPSKLNNATLTGAPVRRLLRNLDLDATKDAALQRLGLPLGRKVIAFVGGSLGSSFLNAVAKIVAEQNNNKNDLCIIHLTGERFVGEQVPRLDASAEIIYKRLAKTDAMEDIFSASDLIVSRAGASTIAELATVGRASVLIPWPQSAENHQFYNAKWLADSGGAVLVDESKLAPDAIAEIVTNLINNKNKLAMMTKSSRIAGEVHRNNKLIQLVQDVVGDAEKFDLSEPRRIHVVGVGGPGMSAVATVLAEMGHDVSGSDVKQSEIIQRLRNLKIKINIGHDCAAVTGCDAVTGSPAISASNIEYSQARESQIRVLTRAEILSAICTMAKSIGVAGTHGKTTTSSMLTAILIEAKLNPNYLIGGDVIDFGRGAHWSGSELFVVEADESDSTHIQLPLKGAVLTNIDIDHLDNFQTFAAIGESFAEFIQKISGPKVLCIDDPICSEIATKYGAITYSASQDIVDHDGADSSPRADFFADNILFYSGSARFTVSKNKIAEGLSEIEVLGDVTIPLRGIHNVRNAMGALVMSMQLGASFSDAVTALAKFGGVARRFEHHGTHRGITFVDDYAHLPNEISSVLAGARDASDSWSRIVAVFQPNRFNRMSLISDLYANAFVGADLIVVTDIYASGTTQIAGVTGQLVVDAILRANPRANVEYKATREQLIDFLDGQLKSGDLCISMGCGDISSLPSELILRGQV